MPTAKSKLRNNNNNRLYLPFLSFFLSRMGRNKEPTISIILISTYQNIIGFLISNTAQKMKMCTFYNQWRILINSAMIRYSGISLATSDKKISHLIGQNMYKKSTFEERRHFRITSRNCIIIDSNNKILTCDLQVSCSPLRPPNPISHLKITITDTADIIL